MNIRDNTDAEASDSTTDVTDSNGSTTDTDSGSTTTDPVVDEEKENDKNIGINDTTDVEVIGGDGGSSDSNPWEQQIGDDDVTNNDNTQNEVVFEVSVDNQYQSWFDKFGGLTAVGIGVDASDKVYDLGITTGEVVESSSAGPTTLIIMLFGVLPFFICLGMYLTSVYLPQSKVGICVNIRKEALKKKCCSSDRKKKMIQMKEPGHDEKEFLEASDDAKQKPINKIYPSTDCDEKKQIGSVNPMTDDEMLQNSKDDMSKNPKKNIKEVLDEVDNDNSQMQLKSN